MLQLWEALKSLFLSVDHSPRILKDFFSSDESLAVVQFLHSAVAVFEKPLKLLQQSKAVLPELLTLMSTFKSQIEDRKEKCFYGGATSESLKLLDDQRRKTLLKSSFDEFYNIVLVYLSKWFRLERLPTKILWVMLSNKQIDYDDVRSLAEQVYPEMALLDALFNEVSEVNAVLREIPTAQFNAEETEKNWMKIFKNRSLPCLKRLVSAILSIPIFNDFIERVFSLSEAQWTDERNRLDVATVTSLLQVKVNYDLNCCEMFHFLLANNELLRKIRRSAKYVT
jgi:hypothetical protein